MSDYYDRAGKHITMFDWAALQETDGYRVVERTTFHDGSFVSTVWLGIDHRLGLGGEPIIFETMDFPAQNMQYRYATESEARDGHAAAVAEYLEAHPELTATP